MYILLNTRKKIRKLNLNEIKKKSARNQTGNFLEYIQLHYTNFHDEIIGGGAACQHRGKKVLVEESQDCYVYVYLVLGGINTGT